MFGSDLIYTALNQASITDLLDTYMTEKALFNTPLIPQDFLLSKSINFYMSTPFFGGLEYGDTIYTANCRANKYEDSRAIAEQVRLDINRSNGVDCFFVTDVLQTIPPIDDTDNYNTPVEIKLRTR